MSSSSLILNNLWPKLCKALRISLLKTQDLVGNLGIHWLSARKTHVWDLSQRLTEIYPSVTQKIKISTENTEAGAHRTQKPDRLTIHNQELRQRFTTENNEKWTHPESLCHSDRRLDSGKPGGTGAVKEMVNARALRRNLRGCDGHSTILRRIRNAWQASSNAMLQGVFA
jgi:hypothetical protein